MSLLTAGQRAELEATVVPAEGGFLVDTCVVGERTAWMRDGGRRKEPFGPSYANIRAACAASAYLRLRSFGSARW